MIVSTQLPALKDHPRAPNTLSYAGRPDFHRRREGYVAEEDGSAGQEKQEYGAEPEGSRQSE